MKIRRMALEMAMVISMFSGMLTGCTDEKNDISSSAPFEHPKPESNVTETNTESGSDIEASESEVEKIWNINTDYYIGANMQNILNGGKVSENEKYVFLIDEYNVIYRYDKETEEMQMLDVEENDDFTGNIVGFMNVTKDGDILFCYSNVKSSTKVDGTVYEIDSETGKITSFLNTREYLTNNFESFSEEIGIGSLVDINSFLLIDDKAYIDMSFTPRDIYDDGAICHYYLAIDIITMESEVIQCNSDAPSFGFFATLNDSGDLIYGDVSAQQIFRYNLETKQNKELEMDNDRIPNVTAVTPEAAYFIHDNEYYKYDLSTWQESHGTVNLPSDVTDIISIAYHDGKFYVHCRDENFGGHNYYWINEDLNESGYLCDLFSITSTYARIGYANGYLWLADEWVIDRISVDGEFADGWDYDNINDKVEKIDVSPYESYR